MIDIQRLARVLTKEQLDELVQNFYAKAAIEVLQPPKGRRRAPAMQEVLEYAAQMWEDDKKHLPPPTDVIVSFMMSRYHMEPDIDVDAVAILSFRDYELIEQALEREQTYYEDLRANHGDLFSAKGEKISGETLHDIDALIEVLGSSTVR